MFDAARRGVLCKTAMDDARLKLVVDQMPMAALHAGSESRVNDKGRKFFADMHRKDLHDDVQWMAKQVYLNVGNFLLGAWRRWVWTRCPSKVLTPPSSMKNLV